MIWTIYSIGDTAFLRQVLQGVAMLCGAGDFYGASRLAMALGVLVVMFRTLLNGVMRIDLMELLTAFIVYTLIFGVKVTVAIESVATGAVVTQANVPIGFAAAGSVVSLFGMTLTQQMEQAFSTPSMMQNGFQSSLNTIKLVRINTMTVAGLGAANQPIQGADVQQSWNNYITECTIPMLELSQSQPQLGGPTVAWLLNQPNFVSALQWQTVVNETLIYSGGAPVTENCTLAFTDLMQLSTASFVPALLAQMSATLGGTPNSSSDASNIIGQALNGVGLGNVSVSDFVLGSAVIPMFYDALATSSESTYNFSYATEVGDAARNRASQWMAQSSLFNLYVQPMLSFIEGFQYAMMPLVLLFVLLGVGGLSIVGKFLGSLLWIQLWYPLLAIVNLYEQMSLTGSMSALQGTGGGILSLAGSLNADQSFLSWMTIGGYMASSVPALAGVVAFGAWSGMETLAGRIGGPENIASDVAAPRVVGQQYSDVAFAPRNSWNPTEGIGQTGVEKILSTLQYSSQNSDSVRSAQTEVVAAANDFRDRFNQSVGMDWSVRDGASHVGSVGRTGRAEYGSALQTLLSNESGVIDQISNVLGVDKTTAGEYMINAGLNGGALLGGAGGSGGKLGATAGGSLGLTGTEAEKQTKVADAQRFMKATFAENPSLLSSITQAVASDIHDNRDRSVFAGKNAAEQRALEQSADRVLRTEKNFEQASSASASGGVSQSVPFKAAVQSILQNPQAREMLWDSVSRMGRFGVSDHIMGYQGNRLRAEFGGSEGAEVASYLMALGADRTTPPVSNDDMYARKLSDQVLSKALGTTLQTPAGERDNKDIMPGLRPPATSLPGQGSVPAEVDQGIADADRKVAATPQTVTEAHQTNLGQQFDAAVAAFRPTADKYVARSLAALKRDGDPDGTEVAVSARRAVANTVSDFGAGFTGALSEKINADIKRFQDEGVKQGLTETQADYYAHRAATSGALRGDETGDAQREALVRAEAKAAYLPGDDIVKALNASSSAPNDGGAGARLKDIGELNQFAGVTAPAYQPATAQAFKDALRSQTGGR